MARVGSRPPRRVHPSFTGPALAVTARPPDAGGATPLANPNAADPPMLAPDLLLPQLLSIADRAGAVLLEHYAAGEVAVATKADRSPVTAADDAAER
jgi:hypothetical protein